MLAVFCLRLACGMLGLLLLLSPAQVNPRFYRTHFLTALGLTAVAAVLAARYRRRLAVDGPRRWRWLLAFLGSLASGRSEGARQDGLLIVADASPVLAAALVLAGALRAPAS